MRVALLALLSVSTPIRGSAQQEPLVIDSGFHHLGSEKLPADQWPEATPEPEGTKFAWSFEARANAAEATLEITQRGVDDNWALSLNGKEIALLKCLAERRACHYRIPPGAIVDGANRLEIVRKTSRSEITVGGVRLHARSVREVLGASPVRVRVKDGDAGTPIAARVTVTDREGKRVDLFEESSASTAARPGIVYTGAGEARFDLAPGEYVVTASRGMEWGIDRAPLVLFGGRPGELDLALRREVDTRGFVACDTHVHTLAFSGHGDASVEERLVTLAGEGVELAVATDHNHNTDYGPLQRERRLTGWFTAVTGNEVTTPNGHFNAFPLDPKDTPPPHKEKDWVKLVAGMRAKGARVVVLNHPRWPALATGPFGVFRLDRHTGERPDGPAFTFDAMELANATGLVADPLYLFRDWFALLDRGERITAVGSSDSHTVHEPVGQGRTYLRSSTDDPAKISIDEACDAFLRGDSSISLGIFAEVEVSGARMGAIVPARGKLVARLRVAAPSWVRPQRALVYLNGRTVAARDVASATGPTDLRIEIPIEPPPNDATLVCVVLGEGIREEFWRTQENYTLAATNPIYLDADGDGRCASPFDTARALVERVGTEPARLREAISRVDDAVAIQAANLARRAYLAEAHAKSIRLLEGSTNREALAEYLKSLAPPPAPDPPRPAPAGNGGR